MTPRVQRSPTLRKPAPGTPATRAALLLALAVASSAGCQSTPEADPDPAPSFLDLAGQGGRPVAATTQGGLEGDPDLPPPEDLPRITDAALKNVPPGWQDGEGPIPPEVLEKLEKLEQGADGLDAEPINNLDEAPLAVGPLAAEEGVADDVPEFSAAPPSGYQEPPFNPYVEFGSRIIVYEGGMIAKPYSLPMGKGDRILQLMRGYANFPVEIVSDLENPPQASENHVLCEVLSNWDIEYFQDMRVPQSAAAKEVPLADWLMITATPELLREAERFINLFLAEVPQIEIEAKIVEVTESDKLEIAVGNPNGPVVEFPGHTLVESLSWGFPGAAANPASVTLGAVQDGTTFNLLIQAAETLENVEISSMPKIAVRENMRAEILNTQEIPVASIGGINQSGSYSATLTYKEVGVKMFVVPRVVGTDTVALYIDIEASAKISDQVFFASSAGGGSEASGLAAPVVAKRQAKTVVFLRPGEGLILGGLTTERTVDKVQRVPFFGSIPILGALFRTTEDVRERTSVLFFIRPRILEGVDLQREF